MYHRQLNNGVIGIMSAMAKWRRHQWPVIAGGSS
jgi:hypothetical protein